MTERNVRRSKVERVIREYELDGLGETLEEYWTCETDPYSLRSLADYFNKQVLQAAMEDAGMHSLDGEVGNTYRLLTDSDVSSGARRQAEQTLEREGIDLDEVRQHFVSHQAIHTYLREYRDVSPTDQSSPENRQKKARETVERLRSRTEAVTENTLQGLAQEDQIPIDEFDVVVDIRAVDTETGETHDVNQLLQ